MQVFELASERIGPVLSPRFVGYERLKDAPATALLQESVLHTTSRPQAWPSWAEQSGLDVKALKYGQGFEHLYYLLEAAVAGFGRGDCPAAIGRRGREGWSLGRTLGFQRNPGTTGIVAAQARCGRARPATGAMAQKRAAPDKLVTAFAQQIGRQQTQRPHGDTGCSPGCSWA